MAIEAPTSTSTPVENWRTFRARIQIFSPTDQRKLDRAYQFSKSSHREQKRESGERFFEHPRSVFLILFDECEVRDVDLLSAALLHDAPEDSALFGNKKKMPYTEWREQAKETLEINFGRRAARILLTVTKPVVDKVRFFTDDEVKEYYYKELEDSPADTKVLKMVDRLHNLKTLQHSSLEKRFRQIKETLEIYMPIFEMARKEYPEETNYLINQIHEAIQVINSSKPEV